MALSQLDQIRKFETGVEKIRQSVPMEAHDPSIGFTPAGGPASAPSRPAISAIPVPPNRSLGARAGEQARRNVNTSIGVAEGVANTAIMPARTLGGFARDVTAGFTGGANPREGKPVAAHFDLPRFNGTPAPTSASPAGIPTPAPKVSDSRVGSPTNPYVKPGTAPATPVANAVQNSGLPAGITRTLDGAGNPVYNGTGASVAAAGGPSQGATVTGQLASFAMPQRTLPQEVVAPANQAGQYQARGRQGGIIANPNAMSALDRIRSLGSDPSLRGSPSLRKLAAEQIMQEAGLANDERQSALSTGDQADLAAVNNNAQANEAFAQRRFDASKFNVGVDLQKRELEAKQRAPFEQQPILRSLDGGTSVLRRDGTLSALTNSDGTSFRVLDPSQRTTVSPDAEFKALTDELTAMSQFPGDGTEQRRGQIQTRMAQLTGQSGQAKQVKRTGTLDGRRVVEYQDGTKAFLD